MDLATLTYPSTLAIVFALLFLCTLWTLLGVRRRLATQDQDIKRLSELIVFRDEDALHGRTVSELGALRDRLDVLTTDLRGVADTQLELKRAPGAGSLQDATLLARQGLSPDELSSRAGVSLGEAELLVRLHSPNNKNNAIGVSH
ncbi:MAG: DUF2802 domain-containing protein [Pseudomonadota bacterium]